MDNDLLANKFFTDNLSKAYNNKIPSEWSKFLLKWNLVRWEDALLYQFIAIKDDPFSPNNISVYDGLLSVMRGENGTQKFNLDEIEVLDIKLIDSQTLNRLTRSLYWAMNIGYQGLQVSMAEKIGEFLLDETKWNSLAPEKQLLLRTIFIIAGMRNLRQLQDYYQEYLFISGYLILAIDMGFNLINVAQEAIAWSLNFTTRENYSLTLANYLLDNNIKIVDNSKSVREWIDTFRTYSKGNFDGMNFINFFNDNQYWENINNENKNIIKHVLNLYVNLINGHLLLPEGNINELPLNESASRDRIKLSGTEHKDSYINIRQKILSSVKTKNINADVKDMYIIDQLRKEFKNQSDNKILELYFYDEISGKFKWNETLLNG